MKTITRARSTGFILSMLFCLAPLAVPAGSVPEHGEADMPRPYVQIQHPEWSRDAVIYQINTRQFTPEGTLEAAAGHLPRLKKLGVDILWLMPIQEIGLINRKGKLGSPYSIRDYRSVNSEYGTLDDMKHFVARAHELGMYVILDWVANHTAWDNPLVEQHPEWYSRDWKGEFHPPPWTDWFDTIQLDYDQPGLRRYMTETMKWWVTEVGLDGFRCDVAGFVPLDFWEQLRSELDAIRPVFMLAEWDTRDLHARAFDMTYGWDWWNALHNVAMGKADAGAVGFYHHRDENTWPEDGIRMLFVSNHDKNAWEGTPFETFGDAMEIAVVLSVVSKGMPLIYNGQEAGNTKRLAFFERDPIVWREHPVGELYRKLIDLKKSNPALWNGRWGADMIKVFNSEPSRVFSFVRAADRHKVFGVFNLSSEAVQVSFDDAKIAGKFTDFETGEAASLDGKESIKLEPWSYRLYSR
jgi:glycosidase